MASIVMKSFFNPAGRDMEIRGIRLELPGVGSIKLFIKPGVLVADEPALKEILDKRGTPDTSLAYYA